MSNYVTVTAEVEFDMEDYIDDILEKLSIEFNNPADLKRHLCDIANAGYCISNEELINEIKLKLP